MDELFLSVLEMSITGALVIAVVLLARLSLRKAPKIFSYALWAVVLFRLLCPFAIESGVSIMPDVPEITAGQVDMILPELEFAASEAQQPTPEPRQSNMPVSGDEGSPALPQTTSPAAQTGHSLAPTVWLSWLWLGGMLVMVCRAAVSYFRLRRRLVGAVKLTENIYLADYIESPFVMGLFRPKIYLPSGIAEGEREYILLHERHHTHRGDHVIKGLAFIALCIHWFNPLVWLAFILAGKDMEMSCDEAVIHKLGESVRADYSASLLSLSTGKRIIAGTPLAFGEGDTKGRIMNLAKWKKPGRWLLVGSAVLVCVLVVVLLLSPADRNKCIRINGRLYYAQENTVTTLPEDSYSLGQLISITHRTGEPPATNFTGSNLDEKYAGCGIYQSGTEAGTVYLEDYSGFYIPFVTPDAAEMDTSGSVSPNLSGADLEPGMVYVSESCLYMSPLSSYSAMGGDSGYRYIVGQNTFITESRAVRTITGEVGRSAYKVTGWLWEDFFWTEEEWAEICDNSFSLSNWLSRWLDGRLEDVGCKQVGENLYLLTLDDALYLMKLSDDAKLRTYVWSIYLLIPEEALGSAQWEFQPLSSAGKPAFAFRFDFEGTEVNAVCTQSELMDFDLQTTDGYVSDHSLTIPLDRPVYWIPSDKEGNAVLEASITFSVQSEDGYICGGTIYISGEETEDENGLPVYVYTAKLVGTGLTMRQDENGSAVISLR